MKKKINVLSLFDGISCARLALDKAKIPINKYYCSEVDKYSIAVSQNRYPDNIFLGDVKKIDLKKLPKIDLLIGGSPCQDISHAFKGKGIEGDRSSLFFDFVRIKNILKPKYFILENVKTKWRNFINEEIKVEGIEVNSKYFSAQNRPRYYWTNIDFNLDFPKNKIQIRDILEQNNSNEFNCKDKISNHITKVNYKENRNIYEIQKLFTIPKTLLKDNERQRRVYSKYGKSPTLLARSDTPKIIIKNKIRKLTPLECERLQGIDDHFTDICSNTQRYKMIGNAFTVPVISYILKNMNSKNKKLKQMDLFN